MAEITTRVEIEYKSLSESFKEARQAIDKLNKALIKTSKLDRLLMWLTSWLNR